MSVIRPLFILSVITYATAVLVINCCFHQDFLTAVSIVNIVLSLVALSKKSANYITYVFIGANIGMSLLFLDYTVNGSSRYTGGWTAHLATGTFLLLFSAVVYSWVKMRTYSTPGTPPDQAGSGGESSGGRRGGGGGHCNPKIKSQSDSASQRSHSLIHMVVAGGEGDEPVHRHHHRTNNRTTYQRQHHGRYFFRPRDN